MPRKPPDLDAPTVILDDAEAPTTIQRGSIADAPTFIREDASTQVVDAGSEGTEPDSSYIAHVILYAEHGFARGVVESISAEGVFVATTEHLDLDTPVRFHLDLPGGTRLVHGEVRWRREARGHDRPAGLGVTFVDLDPVIEEQIKSLLRGNTPRASRRAAIRVD